MGKTLSEMSLNQLWQLFPIILTAHDARWEDWYTDEEHLLRNYLPFAQTVRISHIGSTAISDIWAKPIIDILAEVTWDCDLQMLKSVLCHAGYICMSESVQRMSFNKGYTEVGFAQKVFHLHVRRCGDHDELYFRDYLNEYPDVAKEYEQLKLSLCKPYKHDRDGYTQAKTSFVEKYTKEAKRIFRDRY